jgi:hypothetical protein
VSFSSEANDGGQAVHLELESIASGRLTATRVRALPGHNWPLALSNGGYECGLPGLTMAG